MDETLLSSDQVKVILVFVEVEAHTTSKTVGELLLLVLGELLLLVNDKLEFGDFLWLELILHKVPADDTAIRGDGVEAEVLAIVWLPLDLPDWVSVLAGAHSRLVDWLVHRLVTDIEDHNSSVVATGSDQSWASWMEINAHHARLSGESVLWPGWVLNGEAADETRHWLQEVVGSIGHGEHVLVAWVPAHGSDTLSAALLSGEAPKWQHGSERFRLWIVGVVLVVLVIGEDFKLSVLDDHALHDLQSALHRAGVEWVLLVHLDDLLWLLVLSLELGLLGGLLADHLFIAVHVGVENLPLGGLDGEDGGLGWVSLNATLLVDDDWGLRSALLVVEHVPERLLLLLLTIVGHFLARLLDSLVDLVQKSGIGLLLLLMELLLVASLLRVLQEDVSLDGVMEDELVHDLFSLEAAVLPAELGDVLWSLRVLRIKHLKDGLILLLGGQLFLVSHWQSGVVVDELVLVMETLVLIFVFDAASLGASGLSHLAWWHF